MPIDVGQIVANKYELVRLVGRGSMGEVWSAHHKALGEQVALKLLAWPPSGEDAEEPSVALERFRFEAQVAARLSRKTRHIARVTDYGEDDGQPYLVMELLDGEALDHALKTRGPLPIAEAAEIVSQIARALAQAHAEEVAHRDLKPANVYLTHDEEGRVLVKLLDFGIARTLQAGRARRPQGAFTTAKGFVFGTPGYMSPEQTRASASLDHRCDLWALATIAYQMITAHLPVDGSDADEVLKNMCAGRIVPVRQRDARLPAALDAFFELAFAERVDDRFLGALSLAQAFDLACGGGISGAMLPPSMPSLADSSGSTAIEFAANVPAAPSLSHRRRPVTAVMVAGATLAAVGVTLAGVRAWHSAPGTPVREDVVISAAAAPPQEPAIPRIPREGSPAAVPPATSALPQTEKVAAVLPVRPAASERPAAPAATTSSHPTRASRASEAPLPVTSKPPEDRNDVF